MAFKKLSIVLPKDVTDELISNLCLQYFSGEPCKACKTDCMMIVSLAVNKMRRNVSAFCPKCKANEVVAYTETGNLYVKDSLPPPKPAAQKPVVGESRWDLI